MPLSSSCRRVDTRNRVLRWPELSSCCPVSKLQHINKHMSPSPGPAIVCLGSAAPVLCSFLRAARQGTSPPLPRTKNRGPGNEQVSAACLFWFYFFTPSRLGVRPFFLWRRTENALSPKNLKYYIRTYSPRLRFIQIYNVLRRRHDRAASNRRTYRRARRVAIAFTQTSGLN